MKPFIVMFSFGHTIGGFQMESKDKLYPAVYRVHAEDEHRAYIKGFAKFEELLNNLRAEGLDVPRYPPYYFVEAEDPRYPFTIGDYEKLAYTRNR